MAGPHQEDKPEESEDEEPVIFPYQRIRPNPSTVDLGQPSGAETFREISSKGLPKDDLVDIFRKMLDVGTPEYEHDLAQYIHHGYSSMQGHYEAVERLGRGIQQECDIEDCSCHYGRLDSEYHLKADPERQALEAEYFEEQRKENERHDRIATKLEAVHPKDYQQEEQKEQHYFQCYNPSCDFATNNRFDYETHGVTKHPGKPCYPGKADLWLYGWTAQGKDWEI